MSVQDQVRWNERYAQQTYGQRHHPSALLQQLVTQNVAVAGEPIAWDVACGTGRNLLYLAQCGYSATGLDIADVGLAQARQRLEQAGMSAQFVVHDLELPSLPQELTQAPQLIVVFRYLNLDLLPKLAARLAVGGRLVVEVHLQSTEAVGGPGSARFRAEPGALRQAVIAHQLGHQLGHQLRQQAGQEAESEAKLGKLVIEHDYEGPITDPDGSPMALAQLVVRREA